MKLVFAFALGLVAAACSQSTGAAGDAPPPSSAATSAAPAAPGGARGVVIGHVVTHDARVSIVGRGGELAVVLRKVDGTLVADGIGLDELRARDPVLHTIVTSALASGEGDGAYVDATLDLAHPN